MISEKTRNTLVGATLLVALGLLMYGVLILGQIPSWGGARPYYVNLTAPDANGVSVGSKVDFNGVTVGQVKSVALNSTKGGVLQVEIKLQINGDIDIPASTYASLGKPQIGSPYVSLSASSAHGPMLSKNDKAHLEAHAEDNGLIPKDVRDNLAAVSKQLETVAGDLHTLLAYNTPEEVDATQAHPGEPNPHVENISTLVIRLDRTIKSLQTLLTNHDLQEQVRDIVANLAGASSHLKTSLANVDATLKNANNTVSRFGESATQATATLQTTQKQILRISEKLVDTLDQLQGGIRQLTSGNGTTGKLMTDPHLYDGLVDLSKSMRTTVDDLDFLLKKWKDEGVGLNLK